MRGGRAPRLNEFITAQSVTVDHSSGIRPTKSRDTAVSFWGSITDKPSLVSPVDGQRFTNKRIEIICRTRDVASLGTNTEITLDSDDFTYQIEDMYESRWKFYSTIIAFSITN